MEFPIQWPRCSRFLFNTYHGYAILVLEHKKKTEFGVGQGDPLSMLMYAAAVMPLIKSLFNPPTCSWIQNWHADDSSCTAKLTHLCDWFDKLCEHGPKYGYYPEVDQNMDITHEVDQNMDITHEVDQNMDFTQRWTKIWI